MPTSAERVVITGLGAVTPIGVGVPAMAAAMRAGRTGVRFISFPGTPCRTTAAALCSDFDPRSVLSHADLARLPRLVPMALLAAQEAAAMAGLPVGEGIPIDRSRRTALLLGTGGGGIDFTLDQAAVTGRGGRPSLWSLTNATHGNLAGELSIRLGLRGPVTCVTNGCASASDAAGMALQWLRSDRPGSPDAAIVVGADAHVRWDVLCSMEILGVASVRDWSGDREGAATASRPFDRTRDGFVLGEGAWAVVLERESAARARGARELAELAGFGATCDAYHRVRPAPDMVETARAMTLALADAGLEAGGVGVVHYHGTGTELNDRLETHAMKLALGDHARRVAGTAIKSMLGHPQGASGLAALVAAVASMTDPGGPFVPPTINLRDPDPACDLDYTPLEARPTDATVSLINCLAFGARNSALVVRAGRPS